MANRAAGYTYGLKSSLSYPLAFSELLLNLRRKSKKKKKKKEEEEEEKNIGMSLNGRTSGHSMLQSYVQMCR